jgi:antitoxin ParD1/3/4
MSNTTSINLGNHFTGFISNFAKSGRYGFASEAVQAAMRLLEQEETKFEALRQVVIEAKKSEYSSLTHRQIIEQAKFELDAR